MKSFPNMRILLSVLLVSAIAIGLSGCTTSQKSTANTQVPELQISHITADSTQDPDPSQKGADPFVSAQMQFAVSLFQEVSATGGENVLLSPLSVQLALAMTANGTDGQTKSEIEALLGGSMSLEELNEAFRDYVGGLPSDDDARLHLANSVWLRDDKRLTVNPTFRQCVTDYYQAQVYTSKFDDQTAADINRWVKTQTDGMIEQMVDQISPEALVYLINALAFDAEWQIPYQETSIRAGIFTSASGEQQSVEMMHSTEDRYFETDNAVGFFKNYKGGGYSFVGILPDEGVSLQDFIAGLDAATLTVAMQNASYGSVVVSMPKFRYEYGLNLNDCLEALEMPSAFDMNTADFSRLGHFANENLFLSDVLHKTFIAVDGLGTRAGAATKVELAPGSSPTEGPTIRLDRPFLYMIVDNATNLPLLIGTVTSIGNA